VITPVRSRHGREIEAVGDLRIARDAAIGWEHVADVETLESQHVPQRVLVFAGGQPPQSHPPVPGDPRGIGREECVVESQHGCVAFGVRRTFGVRGRHLALRDPVVDPHEPFERHRIGEIAR
jgi:hypothetical protein